MKKYILSIILVLTTTTVFAQDQTVNGNFKVTGGSALRGDLYVGEWDVSNKTGLGTKLHFGGTGFNSDFVWMAKFVKSDNATDLRVHLGDDAGISDRFVVGNIKWDSNDTWKDWFVVTESGVGINKSIPTARLDVNGSIKGTQLDIFGKVTAAEVEIKINDGADFVFFPSYSLKPLSEVEIFVKENRHLPDIPSEKQMQENGLNLNDMQIKLLQKIEELTLYVINQDKRIEALEQENRQLKTAQP